MITATGKLISILLFTEVWVALISVGWGFITNFMVALFFRRCNLYFATLKHK